MRLVATLAASAALLGAALAWPARAQEAPPDVTIALDAADPALAEHFMVSAANPYATETALAILARGGSAVDAAIAVQLVLGLVEPQSSGIGGGAFMLVHAARRRAAPRLRRARDRAGRRERPTASSTPTARRSPFATACPAAVGRRAGHAARAELAHARHGRLPWAELFAPAIAARRAGFPVSPAAGRADRRRRAPGARTRRAALFPRPAGRPLAAGTLLRNPAYAATLRTLAREGAGAFYQGAIAGDIVATVAGRADRPGGLTRADLAGYRAIERDAAVRALPALPRLRHAAAVVGRDDRAGDPRHARALRRRVDGRRLVLERALLEPRPAGSRTRTATATSPIPPSSTCPRASSIRPTCGSARA